MASNVFDFDRAVHGCGQHVLDDVLCAVISKMKEICAEHGVPDILRSNNGLQYTITAFTEFTGEWGFQDTTSSPHYPASNGFAESMVKIIKTAFTKAKYSGKDPPLTLLALHSTLVDSHLLSPM